MPVLTYHSELASGWYPDTPEGDTLVHSFLESWIDSIGLMSAAQGARQLLRDDLVCTDTGRPAGFNNSVTLRTPLTSDHLPEMLAEMDDFFDFAGSANGAPDAKTGMVLLLSPWPTPDLTLHGWQLLGHPPLMIRAPGGACPPPPPGLRIEKIHGADQLRDATQVIDRGFWDNDPDPDPFHEYAPAILDDPRLHAWVGYEGDQPVAAGIGSLTAGINNVMLISTVPEARRKGYGTAITWPPTLIDPTRPAALVASDDGRPIYERMGYLAVTRFMIWIRHRSVPEAAT